MSIGEDSDIIPNNLPPASKMVLNTPASSGKKPSGIDRLFKASKEMIKVVDVFN